jgi:transcriptional regulator of heat shock response
MDDKLKKILGLVVEDLVRTGEPVGSQHFVEAHGLDVSSATIRNWFAELEEQGYLMHPHTSSGRQPTEKGYRFFVDEIMDARPLSRREQLAVEAALGSATEPERRLKNAAKTVAELAGNAVVLGLGEADAYYTGLSQLFSQPEFGNWGSVVSLGNILDSLDEMLLRVRRERFVVPTFRLGEDCPFGSVCGSALLTLKDGSFIAVLGPMRMDYRLAGAALNSIKHIMP